MPNARFNTGGGSVAAAAAASNPTGTPGLGSVTPIIFGTHHEEFSLGTHAMFDGGGVAVLASTTVSAADRAFAYPFWLPGSMVVTKAWWHNGGTVAGNVEVAVYSAALAKVATTGSVAAAGVTAVQSAALSTTLTAGQYYLWVSASDATMTFIADGVGSANRMAHKGIFMQSSVGPGSSPSTATPVTPVSFSIIMAGLQTRDVL